LATPAAAGGFRSVGLVWHPRRPSQPGATGAGRGASAEVKRPGPGKGALHVHGKSVEVDVLFVAVAVGDVRFVTVP